jgi:hypothetical protein
VPLSVKSSCRIVIVGRPPAAQEHVGVDARRLNVVGGSWGRLLRAARLGY